MLLKETQTIDMLGPISKAAYRLEIIGTHFILSAVCSIYSVSLTTFLCGIGKSGLVCWTGHSLLWPAPASHTVYGI